MGLFAELAANDWQYWPEREDITYTVRLNSGNVNYPLSSTLAGVVGCCKRSALTVKEAEPSNAVYVNEDLNLILPAANIPAGVVPKIGDSWTDAASVTWTIIGACKLNTWKTWWVLPSRDMVLVNGLTDSIDIWAPTNSQDASSNRVPNYGELPLYAAIACRFQPLEPIEEDVEDNFEKLALVARFMVYLPQQVSVTSEMQVRPAGQATPAYQIKSVHNVARVDQLMSLEVELIP